MYNNDDEEDKIQWTLEMEQELTNGKEEDVSWLTQN